MTNADVLLYRQAVTAGRFEPSGSRRRGPHRARPAACAAAAVGRQHRRDPRSVGLGQPFDVHRTSQRDCDGDGHGPHPLRRSERSERQHGFHRCWISWCWPGRSSPTRRSPNWWAAAQRRCPTAPSSTTWTSCSRLQTGWLGIKTGWTGAAGGCLLFAAQMALRTPGTGRHRVGRRPRPAAVCRRGSRTPRARPGFYVGAQRGRRCARCLQGR